MSYAVVRLMIVWCCVGAIICGVPNTVEAPTTSALRDVRYGLASWYGASSPGVLPTTANLERFDENALTCASWALPFNTLVRVRNMDTGASVVVRVNDRGPADRLVKAGRIIDLSKAAFQSIARLSAGLVHVEVEVVSYPNFGLQST